ncbi:MAG: alanine racemase [Gammaproteobacteria bacterium]|nr:alanine racemase [Gammaproteobacteria bacterium]
MHRVQASIDLKALQHNFQIARSRAKGSKVAAIIKANAYGHGLVQAAKALTDADLFGVTDVHEAVTLEQAATGKPILVLQGMMHPDDLQLVAEHNFQLVIHSAEQLAQIDETFSRLTLKQPLTLWLKMDSGMGRLGLSPHGFATTYKALLGRPYTDKVVMMTHLANSSQTDSPLNLIQLNAFRETETELAGDIHATSIASSSGILSDLPVDSDWARPGIMLYGSSPFDYSQEALRREAFDLKAVMTLQARIIAVKDMHKGDNIGYSSQYICEQDMRVGIVSIGYADGYPSNAPNDTPVMVQGKKTATLGRVSMDMLAVNLSDIPDANVGDLATLWGQELSLDEVAAKTGILSYNLTCSVAQRVNFEYR